MENIYSKFENHLCTKPGCKEKIDHIRGMVWCAKHMDSRGPIKIPVLKDADREIYGVPMEPLILTRD